MMQYKFFTIPVPAREQDEEEINKFLRGHRIISVDKELITTSSGGYWSFLVEYYGTNQDGAGKNKCEQYGELFIKVIKDMNVTEPYFDRYLIDQTYACRENKGTHKALLQAFHYTKGSDYFCKMDVRKYFDSIDHEVLKQLLRRRFKDRTLLHVFDRIIDSYETVPGKGVPIGNLTSQHFANFYLNPLDRFCKERLGCRRYVRYMDDFVFWEDDIRSIKQKREAIQGFLTDTLTLGLKLSHFDSVNRGVPFLGFLVNR